MEDLSEKCLIAFKRNTKETFMKQLTGNDETIRKKDFYNWYEISLDLVNSHTRAYVGGCDAKAKPR